MATEKELLEVQLIEAQRDKTLAEIKVLQRTTPITEAIKVFGSMILGIGGVLAAFAGFQFAEVKAEKARNEMANIEDSRKKLNTEVSSLEDKKKELELQNQTLTQKNRILVDSIAKAGNEVEKANDMLSAPALASNPQLDDVRQSLNATGIELRTTTVVKNAEKTTDLDSLIQGLFSPQAGERGKAYEKIISQYSNSESLIPALLDYANANKQNENGIYNTLVVFSRLDKKLLQDKSSALRTFAESVRSTGPRTSERVDILLSRIPNA
ncbi:hypothetical protein N8H71_22360 [Pseudomonas koreensis]|uniref:hypothetical protein n=1 Tax=Pseudomonas koreensis TaxID=198620 RepID=UPI0021C7458B|nr:hypothetical protein [Pseudomonas koreensis]MCU0074346.1 hypothetical protein [Pseudomonas koreensis]